MKNYFLNKNVYITGGSSGIGLACAKLCAQYGSNVIIIARDEKKLQNATNEISALQQNNSQHFAWASIDVTNEKVVLSEMTKLVRTYGAPNILIASAGASYADYFENITYQKFDEILKINVYGIRNTIFALLPFMKHKQGHIVIVSSLAGLIGVFGYGAYGTSKFAAVGLAECLRPELRQYNITVSVVCPPEVDTPLLQKENEISPKITKMLKKFTGLLTVEYAAKSILRGIAKKKFLIIPGIRSRLTYFFHRHSGGKISRFVSDVIVKTIVPK